MNLANLTQSPLRLLHTLETLRTAKEQAHAQSR